MNTQRIPAAIAAVLIAASVGQGASASSARRDALRRVAERADRVVAGRVLKVEGRWVDGLIVSRIQMSTDACLKGSCNGKETFDVFGGTVGDITQRVVGLALPRTGEELMVVLENHEGVMKVRSSHGIWTLIGDREVPTLYNLGGHHEQMELRQAVSIINATTTASVSPKEN